MARSSPQEELEELDEIQDRIDAVAKDLSSGRNRYSKIETWELGELLGLDFYETADWSKSYLAYLQTVDEQGFEHPIAENIELLKESVSAKRYEVLQTRAEKCLKAGRGDMRIRKKERELLNEKYTRVRADGWSSIVVASTSLEASEGAPLEFEACIGDGGEVSEVYSPYAVDNGKGFDFENYVEVGDG